MNLLAIRILRYSFIALFLWFGLRQLIVPASYVGYLPVWTGYLPIPGTMLVQLNGWFEIIACVFLAAGIFTRWVAILVSAHLAYIAYEVGGDTGVRDIILAMMGFALAACKPEPGTIDYKTEQQKLAYVQPVDNDSLAL